MPTAWFVCRYKRRLGRPHPTRYCAMDDFTDQIRASGGDWTETEVLGGYAVVKVRASDDVLAAIAAASGFFRLPLRLLTESLGSLTNAQRTAISQRLLAMGYTQQELTAALGNLRQRTLADALRFAASRRRKPRYDAVADQIVCDGPVQACRPVDDVDREVAE